jgi:predicted DNA-binding transcriptional regulator YafY
VLANLALLCRDRERLRFRYTSWEGVESSRHVEPHSLVPYGRRWYFVCWDVDRVDWRTFRIDRMTALLGTGARFTPRELPADDAAEFVRAAASTRAHKHEAVVHLQATTQQVHEYFGVWASGSTETAQGTVDWPVGGGSVPEIISALLWIPADMGWTITCSDEVREALRRLQGRLAAVV